MVDQPKRQLSDTDIALMMMEGDQEGLRALLKTHGGKVKGALKKRYAGVLDEFEIDQTMNTAAFNVWRFAQRYDESKGSLGAWFLRIARNAAKNILRGETRHLHKNLEYDPAYDPAEWWPEDDTPRQPAIATNKEEKNLLADFHAAIERLPRLQKAIIKADLAADGLADAKRLARKHGSSVGSIYTSRNNARATLKQEMIRLGHYRHEMKEQR